MSDKKALLSISNLSLFSLENEIETVTIRDLSFNVYEETTSIIYSNEKFSFDKVYEAIINRQSAESYIRGGSIKYFDFNDDITSSQKYRVLRSSLHLSDNLKLDFIPENISLGKFFISLYKEKKSALKVRYTLFMKKAQDMYDYRKAELDKKIEYAQEIYEKKKSETNEVCEQVIDENSKRLEVDNLTDIARVQTKERNKEVIAKRETALANLRIERDETIEALRNDWNNRQAYLYNEIKKSRKRAKIDNTKYRKSVRHAASIEIAKLKEKLSDANSEQAKEIRKQIIKIILTTHEKLRVSTKQAKKCVIELLNDLGIAQPDLLLKKLPIELDMLEKQKVNLAYMILQEYKVNIIDESHTNASLGDQIEIFNIIQSVQNKYHLCTLFYTNEIKVLKQAKNCYFVLVRNTQTMEMGFEDFHSIVPITEYGQTIYNNVKYKYNSYELDTLHLRKIDGEHYASVSTKEFKRIKTGNYIPLAQPRIKIHPETGMINAEDKNVYRIGIRADTNKWYVKLNANSRALKLFKTKEEAIDYVKKINEKNGYDVIVIA